MATDTSRRRREPSKRSRSNRNNDSDSNDDEGQARAVKRRRVSMGHHDTPIEGEPSAPLAGTDMLSRRRKRWYQTRSSMESVEEGEDVSIVSMRIPPPRGTARAPPMERSRIPTAAAAAAEASMHTKNSERKYSTDSNDQDDDDELDRSEAVASSRRARKFRSHSTESPSPARARSSCDSHRRGSPLASEEEDSRNESFLGRMRARRLPSTASPSSRMAAQASGIRSTPRNNGLVVRPSRHPSAVASSAPADEDGGSAKSSTNQNEVVICLSDSDGDDRKIAPELTANSFHAAEIMRVSSDDEIGHEAVNDSYFARKPEARTNASSSSNHSKDHSGDDDDTPTRNAELQSHDTSTTTRPATGTGIRTPTASYTSNAAAAGGPTCPRCTFIHDDWSAVECVMCAQPLVARMMVHHDEDSSSIDQDHRLAKKLQGRQERNGHRRQSVLMNADAQLAMKLHEQEQRAVRQAGQRKDKEHKDMLTTKHGRAWVLIQQVLDLHKRLTTGSAVVGGKIETVAVDDMVFLAEKFIDCHATFQSQSKPHQVEFAYHYTDPKNLESIKQDGLMSGEERVRNGIQSRRVEAFGSGIYTANNPFAFHNSFGSVGLLVAILKGTTQRLQYTVPAPKGATGVDTVIGNKTTSVRPSGAPTNSSFHDEIVLKQSMQCLPLIKFPTSIVSTSNHQSPENDMLWAFQEQLQKVMDNFFHNGRVTALNRVYPSSSRGIWHSVPATTRLQSRYQAFRFLPSALPVPPVPPTQPNVTRPASQALVAFQSTAATSTAASAGALPMPSVRPAQSIAAMPGPTPKPIAAMQSAPAALALPSIPTALTGQAPAPSARQVNHPSMRHSRRMRRQALSPPSRPSSPPALPAAVHSRRRRRRRVALPSIPSPPGQTSPDLVQFAAPSQLPDCTSSAFLHRVPTSEREDSECPLCLESLLCDKPVFLEPCKHQMHRKCIEMALKRSSRCPICRKVIGEPHGHSPSGTMTVTRTGMKCSGFERDSVGTIQITYNMSGGRQMSYHQNPGRRFGSTTRLAYLPDNADGNKILQRLKYAFRRGLTFTIGTSLTTQQQNCIVWSSIHHKTSMSGGAHGFPDPLYLQNCNDDLDALGVPPAQDCS